MGVRAKTEAKNATVIVPFYGSGVIALQFIQEEVILQLQDSLCTLLPAISHPHRFIFYFYVILTDQLSPQTPHNSLYLMNSL